MTPLCGTWGGIEKREDSVDEQERIFALIE